MRRGLLFVAMMSICLLSQAQFNRYVIVFKDKGTSPFNFSNPSAYLTARAIDRRTRYQIVIDSTDLPVTPRYIDSIRLSGNVQVLNVSKWLNQVSIETTDAAALTKISNFSFVQQTQPIAAKASSNPVNKLMNPVANSVISNIETAEQNLNNVFNYGKSNGQITIHQGEFLHNHGFRGEGMQLALLDGGFYHYNTLPTFDSINLNQQVLGTWDFVENELSVSEDATHGMACLSTIAANLPGVFVGSAPKTALYLYRTEDVNTEYPIEEHNFAVAAERADSLGVDICSTSLGYTTFDDPVFDYSYNDMNGHTTLSAKAANIAARKGMLMVIAAGNEGNNSWHYIATPADADSGFAVGAVDTLGQAASFSSYGPSSDGDIKPNVASVGRSAVVANSATGLPTFSNGTSFACPNMAGITTCLWQAFPEANNMEIISTLQQSANNIAAPNDRIGFGIPNAKKAFVMLQQKYHTQSAQLNQCNAILQFAVKTDPTMSIELERRWLSQSNYTTLASLQSNLPYGMHDFNYTDDLSTATGTGVQYRLKMNIDADTSYYLDSATLYLNSPCQANPSSDSLIQIAPNPVIDQMQVSITNISFNHLQIQITNAVGQKVLTQTFNYQANPYNVPMQGYSKGIYFVTILLDNKKMVTKKITRL